MEDNVLPNACVYIRIAKLCYWFFAVVQGMNTVQVAKYHMMVMQYTHTATQKYYHHTQCSNLYAFTLVNVLNSTSVCKLQVMLTASEITMLCS